MSGEAIPVLSTLPRWNSPPAGAVETGRIRATRKGIVMNETGKESAPDNPMGTDGFEFVEYTAPNPGLLGELFEQMGFTADAPHPSHGVRLYRQGRGFTITNPHATRLPTSILRGRL